MDAKQQAELLHLQLHGLLEATEQDVYEVSASSLKTIYETIGKMLDEWPREADSDATP